MSYRAFKHLLGETSLERKCRFLFGAGILLLLTACFWWYAHRTEKPIYDQYTITCRFLANKTLTDEYLKRQLKPPEWQRIEELSKANMPKTLLSYSSDIIIPNTAHRLDPNEKDLLKEFQNDPDMNEHWQTREPKAGELNVRSEIQTGDEFEDLSHAFNRMLRNLVSMQERLKKANTGLDRKVDELAQANMALYESNRLKSDFLATMSHELRTPLNSILGFSEVLLSSNQLSDKQQRWVRNIQTSGDQLLNLINDILDLAKIEAGKMKLRLEEFGIQELCDGMINMFRPLAEKKNIDLRGQVDPGIPLLKQDLAKLQQMLSDLLSNAIKFTPEGGRVMVKAEADPGYLTLTVTDTGVGIAPEEQELIFEKFRQSGNPLTRAHAGTGLGLSIVRELARLLGREATPP